MHFMTKRLFVGRIDSSFNPSADLALGPWCYVGNESFLNTPQRAAFVDPFPSVDDWVEADRWTRRLANQLIPLWADRLNARFQTSYSPRFWRVMVLGSMIMVTQAFWYRYRYIQDFAARHGATSFDVPICASQDDWGIAETADLLEMLNRPDIDFRLSSLVLGAMAPPTWRLQDVPAPPDVPLISNALAPAATQTLAGRMLEAVLGRLPFAHVAGVRSAKLLLSAYLAVLPRRNGVRDHYDFDDDAVLEQCPQAFRELLDRVLWATLPHSISRNFPTLEKAARGRRYYPGRLLVDQVATQDDGMRTIIAMAHEKGEKLVGAQHGGAFGTARAMMAQAETEYRFHGFLTWGWTAQGDCAGRFIPVPSPQASRLRNRHRERAAEVLLVGTGMGIHGIRLGWLPKPMQCFDYRDDKIRFLLGLAQDVRTRSLYRPFLRRLSDIEDGRYVFAASPETGELTGELEPRLLGCRLLVIDHPGTTMIMALAANVPTILFWDPAVWPLCRQAEPVFDALRQAGILFHDPVAAATQANRVWNDVPGWWQSPERQQARRHWVSVYARTSRVWWLHWMAALYRLAH